MQTLCLNSKFKNFEWRLVYLLLDAGTPGLTADCDLRTFARALFYVGKGTQDRPFEHLMEAKDFLLKPNSDPNKTAHEEPTRCAQRIADIWRDGRGVIVVPVIKKLYDKDPERREAAIISLKDAGLKNLVNSASGVFKGHEHWSAKDRMELGVMQLVKAFKLYREKALRHWYLPDVPIASDEIQLWHSVCPTPYRTDAVEEGPHTSDAHISAAAGKPTRSGLDKVDKASVPQEGDNQELSLQASTSAKNVPFQRRSAVQQTADVAGTSAQSSSTSATLGAVRSQKSVLKAAIPPSTLSRPQLMTGVGSVVVEKEVDDDNTRFGRNVADFLNSLPRQRQRLARIRLEGLMQEIEFGPQANPDHPGPHRDAIATEVPRVEQQTGLDE